MRQDPRRFGWPVGIVAAVSLVAGLIAPLVAGLIAGGRGEAQAPTVTAPPQARAPAGPPPPGARGPGRGSAAPPPIVLNLGVFGLAVQDLDASVRFYRDGLGLDLVAAPSEPVIDAERNAVMGTAGARTRVARFAVPNEPFAIELVEYTGIDRRPRMSHHNDPGSSFINIGYVDVGATFQALRPFAPRMVGEGTFPPGVNGGLDVAWIRDPDGQIVELMHGGWDSDRKAFHNVRNAYRAHFGVTMENYRQALSFYRDLLGFDLDSPMVGGAIGDYRVAGGMSRMLGVPAEANFTGIGGHCTSARCEMFEFKDAPRTPFTPRVQDPGAALLSVWVSDLDALLARAALAGVAIVTPGGRPVEVRHKNAVDVISGGGGTAGPLRVRTSRQVLVHDPGGFPVLLMQRVN